MFWMEMRKNVPKAEPFIHKWIVLCLVTAVAVSVKHSQSIFLEIF